MKNFTKILSCALCCVLVCFAVVACSSDGDKADGMLVISNKETSMVTSINGEEKNANYVIFYYNLVGNETERSFSVSDFKIKLGEKEVAATYFAGTRKFSSITVNGVETSAYEVTSATTTLTLKEDDKIVISPMFEVAAEKGTVVSVYYKGELLSENITL